jgi:predicted ester cyclase
MRYIVIENTPGYLPEDDPFVTDDYSAAVAYMNERAAEYTDNPDGNYRIEVGIASSNNYAAVMVWDDDKTHDLGRYIGVEINEEDEVRE